MIPESTWQAIWDQENPKGWFDETFDARTAATRGDMTALKLVAKYFPEDFEVSAIAYLLLFLTVRLCLIQDYLKKKKKSRRLMIWDGQQYTR